MSSAIAPEPLNVALIGGLFGGLSLLLLVIGTLALFCWMRKKKQPHPHDDADVLASKGISNSNQYDQISQVQLRSNVYSSAPNLDAPQYDKPDSPLNSNLYEPTSSALN